MAQAMVEKDMKTFHKLFEEGVHGDAVQGMSVY